MTSPEAIKKTEEKTVRAAVETAAGTAIVRKVWEDPAAIVRKGCPAPLLSARITWEDPSRL